MSNKELDLNKVYEFRFQGVDHHKKDLVWREIAKWMYTKLGQPQKVLDPACGELEFLRHIPSSQKWGVDLKKPQTRVEKFQFIHGNIKDVELPKDFFDAVYVSNFLEHLHTPEEVQTVLQKIHQSLKPQGKLAIMGPNFKYCSDVYFDCADHRLALTDVSVNEHLMAARYNIDESIGRFLPFSFRGLLPPSPILTKMYLSLPFAWKILGKQFLIIASK